MSGTGGSAHRELAQARDEIARLRRRLADERFAKELKEALTLAASSGTIAAPVAHSRLLEMVVETAASVIPSQAASLFLIDEEAGEADDQSRTCARSGPSLEATAPLSACKCSWGKGFDRWATDVQCLSSDGVISPGRA